MAVALALKAAEALHDVQLLYDQNKQALNLGAFAGVKELSDTLSALDTGISNLFALASSREDVMLLHGVWQKYKALMLQNPREKSDIARRSQAIWNEVFPQAKFMPEQISAVLSRRIQLAFESAFNKAKAQLYLKYLREDLMISFKAKVVAMREKLRSSESAESVYKTGSGAEICLTCCVFIQHAKDPTERDLAIVLLSLRRIKDLGEYLQAYRFLQTEFKKVVLLTRTYPFVDARQTLIKNAFFLLAKDKDIKRCLHAYSVLMQTSLASKFEIDYVGDRELTAEQSGLLQWFFTVYQSELASCKPSKDPMEATTAKLEALRV